MDNQAVLRKNFLFGILLVAQHVIVCLIYGFLFREPVRTNSDAYYFNVNYSPIFIVTSQYVFVLVGTGVLYVDRVRLTVQL